MEPVLRQEHSRQNQQVQPKPYGGLVERTPLELNIPYEPTRLDSKPPDVVALLYRDMIKSWGVEHAIPESFGSASPGNPLTSVDDAVRVLEIYELFSSANARSF